MDQGLVCNLRILPVVVFCITTPYFRRQDYRQLGEVTKPMVEDYAAVPHYISVRLHSMQLRSTDLEEDIGPADGPSHFQHSYP